MQDIHLRDESSLIRNRMKSSVRDILTLLLAGFLVCHCNGDESQSIALTAEVSDWSGCKSLMKSADGTNITPGNLSCVSYSFDESTNRLALTHINAGFNCCAESIYCHATLHNGKIIVHEFETSAPCDCNCLYDLDLVIDGIQPRFYMIEFVEPYRGNQAKLVFAVNLAKQREGSFCVTRTIYPWGLWGLD